MLHDQPGQAAVGIAAAAVDCAWRFESITCDIEAYFYGVAASAALFFEIDARLVTVAGAPDIECVPGADMGSDHEREPFFYAPLCILSCCGEGGRVGDGLFRRVRH